MNEKALSIRIFELKNRLIQAINDSQLPACIVQEIVMPIFTEIAANAKAEYEKDLAVVKEEDSYKE